MMKKYLILIAGSPATGKSHVVKIIQDRFKNALLIAPDNIKEMYAESFGFSNLHEKKLLVKESWKFYYSILHKYMEVGKRIIISEYPFSFKQSDKLKKFSKDYNYEILTVRLVADFDVLWKRRYNRDRESSRHLSHIMTSYHYGDTLIDRDQADNHISRDEFKNIIVDRKYDEFVLGKSFEIDMTDFSQVDYSSIIKFLEENIQT